MCYGMGSSSVPIHARYRIGAGKLMKMLCATVLPHEQKTNYGVFIFIADTVRQTAESGMRAQAQSLLHAAT